MKERSTKLSSNFIYNSAAAVGSAAAVAGILFVLYWFAASSSLPFMWNILFFFHPLNQGLNDHTAYGVIMIYTLSSLLFVSLLINQRAKKLRDIHCLGYLLQVLVFSTVLLHC